jgi:hypothetical protein
MSPDAQALLRHADAIATERVLRRGHAPPDVVVELAHAVAERVARELLDRAGRDPRLAAALIDLYPLPVADHPKGRCAPRRA